MKLAIRADASLDIGSGHVMRCLTLAQVLQERGAQVHFVCRAHPGHFGDYLRARGFAVSMLPMAAGWRGPRSADAPAHAGLLGADWQDDAAATLAALAGVAPDWVVVDHYALDARWETAMRACGARIMALDDLGDRVHDCDVLLDQNYPPRRARYAGLAGPGCRLLLGPTYALLRHEFAFQRARATMRAGAIGRVFVFFGGVDQPNLTARALKALRQAGGGALALDVVIGKDNPHSAEIDALCAAWPGARLHRQVDNMAELMARADLAIGAGGATSWERCCVGLPSLIVTIAANQEPATRALVRDGLAFDGGSSDSATVDSLCALLAPLLAQPQAVHALALRTWHLVDGAGAGRVAQVLSAPALRLRPATPADVGLYYDWANDEDVRAQSFNQAPIDYDAHAAWFAQRLASPDSLLLLAQDAQLDPVGQVRFDKMADGTWKIGFSVDRRWRGRGVAAPMLTLAIASLAVLAPAATMVAQVKRQNLPSSKAFLALGFRERDALEDVLTYVRNVKELGES